MICQLILYNYFKEYAKAHSRAGRGREFVKEGGFANASNFTSFKGNVEI